MASSQDSATKSAPEVILHSRKEDKKFVTPLTRPTTAAAADCIQTMSLAADFDVVADAPCGSEPSTEAATVCEVDLFQP